jgi:glycosyltransferase 2 family protein
VTEQSAAARPGTRARLLKVARVGLTVAALAFVLLALASRWDEVRGQLGQVSVGAVVAAFGCTLLGLFFAMLGWRALLADLGSPLPVGAATRVLFLGQLAKYLPGSSVWAMVAQTELARDFGVPRKRAAAAALVLNLVTLGVGLLVTLLALPRLLDSEDTPAVLRWTPLLIPVGLAFLTPPVLTRVCNLLFRVLRRQPLDESFSWAGMAKASAATLGTWTAYGVQIALLAHSLGAGWDVLLPATGAFAAAWCAGFLVVVVPTGAGTREAVLTVALAPQLAAGAAGALTVAVVSRLLLTVADVVAACVGAALGRRRRARPVTEPAGAVSPS